MTKPTRAEMAALVERLRATPNWQRQEFGDWKSATNVYDRAPFEAADAIEALMQERAEPAAWRLYHGKESGNGGWHYYESDPGNGGPLYATPPSHPAPSEAAPERQAQPAKVGIPPAKPGLPQQALDAPSGQADSKQR